MNTTSATAAATTDTPATKAADLIAEPYDEASPPFHSEKFLMIRRTYLQDEYAYQQMTTVRHQPSDLRRRRASAIDGLVTTALGGRQSVPDQRAPRISHSADLRTSQ